MAAPALDKYASLKTVATDHGIADLAITEQGGKLQVTGTAPYQFAKDEVWNAIKKNAGWENEIGADIKVANTDIHGVYTVRVGRHAVEDREVRLRRRQRLPAHLRGQQRHPQEPRPDPDRPEAQTAEVRSDRSTPTHGLAGQRISKSRAEGQKGKRADGIFGVFCPVVLLPSCPRVDEAFFIGR